MRIGIEPENFALADIRYRQKTGTGPSQPIYKLQVESDLFGFVVGAVLHQGCAILSSFTTLFTPFVFFAIFSALLFCLSSSTVPRRITAPSFTTTSIAPPFTT